MVPLITLEEHYHSKAAQEANGEKDPILQWPQPLIQKLHSLGDERLRDMDRGAVSLQVISHTPTQGSLSPAGCRAANDELSAGRLASPARLAAFAALPMAQPAAAAAELARCVHELGFVGALIDNHCGGRSYDDEAFWPVFAAAQRLGVPLYLHPDFPPDDLAPRYRGNFAESAAVNMSVSGFGWHAECALHVLRLFAAGVWDRFPRLQLIVGHMGEMLPFQLERIVWLSARWGKRERGLRQVWDENLIVTTSGMFSLAPMACLLRSTRIDRILYSVDYPFSKNEEGLRFMEELEKSGLVTREEFEMIAYKNAERVLKVKV